MPQSIPMADEKAPISGGSATTTQRKHNHSRIRPRRTTSGTGDKVLIETRSKGGSVIFTVLLAGLVFSLIDVLYMIKLVDRTEFQPNNRVPVPQTSFPEKTKDDGDEATPKKAETPSQTTAKKEVFDLIQRAGLNTQEMDWETLAELPTWDEVVGMYGSEPVIHGLDRCDEFQEITQKIGFVGAAGTFNSGTNLMAELLIANCHMQERMNKLGSQNRGIRWQVPWGKHTPPGDDEFRRNHKTYHDADIGADQILPAVTIRDPLTWLISMCHHPYAAKWEHAAEHCPDFSVSKLETTVKYAEFKRKHKSILDLWNDYYRDYLEVSWPRLIVRIEDLIFHPEKVTTQVCECAGGSMRPDGKFKFIVNSAKKGTQAHGKQRTGMVDAIIKYGSEKKRYESFISPKDLEYIRDNVDPELLKLMNYSSPDPSRARGAVATT